MAPNLPTVLAAISAVGLVHTLTSHYLDKAHARRKREALLRLEFKPARPYRQEHDGDS